MAAQILDIWHTVAPLKKDRSRASMETTCRRTSTSKRFCHPRIPHAFAVIVVVLAFHTKDPDGVGDALNIFL